MKQFFKMMFASTLGVFIAAGLIIIIGTFILMGIVASYSTPSEYSPRPNTVLKLSLSGSLADNAEDNPLAFIMGETTTQLSLKDILKSIRVAKNNSNVEGIYIESGALLTGTASVDAIRRALIDFKESGKFVIAYADNYTQGGYYLCSVADKVYLNPKGIVGLTGFASQTTFYKGLLNKIGVEMQIFKVGTYKGAVEPFMLDKLSDENREQISSYLQSIWNNICAGIADARNISVDNINRYANEGLMFTRAENTIELGLVDELQYKSDVEEYIKELAGQTGNKLRATGIDRFRYTKETEIRNAGQIAVLYAEGEIMDEVTSIYNRNQVISGKVARELDKLRKNEDVKAVVFRVNSPGGSAFISEQIWHAVVKLKAEKPVVVSMGNTAASGGYYISCAADKIIAEKNTLTGSIGIFGIFPNATGLFDKLDVTTDVVKTNTYADLGDISRPMREDEKVIIQKYIEEGYDTFITRCADGRGMSKEAIDNIGQGRVWTGEQALERGLVDELGGMDRAVEVAAQLADISDYNIIHVSGNKDFITGLLEKQLDELKINIVKNMLGEEMEYVKTLNTIRSNTGILTRLPYDLQPL